MILDIYPAKVVKNFFPVVTTFLKLKMIFFVSADSRFNESVMHMIVHDKLKSDFRLHEDDIKGIQRLYGRRRRGGRRRHWNRIRNNHIINNNVVGNAVLQPEVRPEVRTAPASGSLKVVAVPEPEPSPQPEVGENPGESENRVEVGGLENTLRSFWECFGLSYNGNGPEGSDKASDCYARNVLKLISSLNL